MPTPIDILLDPITLTVIALYGALILWEAVAPARLLPRVSSHSTHALNARSGTCRRLMCST